MDIVYTVNDYDTETTALFATREVAARVARIWRAMLTASTWGEFRRAITESDYVEIATRSFGEMPGDDVAFSSGQIPGSDDGYYPGGWPDELVREWFPDDLIDKHDGWTEFTPNGISLKLPASAVEGIAADLRLLGHTVTESLDDLPTFVRCAYAGKP